MATRRKDPDQFVTEDEDDMLSWITGGCPASKRRRHR